MGLSKKMEWLKWLRKYSTGILETKTSSSMETLIDSASQKTINYGYTSSVIAADDEFINASAAAPSHRRHHQKQQDQQQKQQRPMLPPPAPATSQDPSPANDVYDCCVSLDGIPVRHEFQYTLSDADGCGTVTKHDIEGLASKILESVYETTLKFSSRGQRTIKVTLNVRQTASQQSAAGAAPVKQLQRVVGGRESFRQNYYGRTSADRTLPQYVGGGGELQPAGRCPIYGVVKGGSSSHHIRTKYRREQLIEMVQRSLAENLSFQNQRKPSKPETIYHRPRTKRRQSSGGGSANPPSSPATPAKPVVRTPAKVGWSPYDFEPVAHIPSSYHPHYQQQQQHYHQQRQQHYLNAARRQQQYQQQHRQQQHQQQQQQLLYGGKQHQTSATQAAAGGRPHHQQQRSAKKIHHHIHEHHHYHHYEHYIV